MRLVRVLISRVFRALSYIIYVEKELFKSTSAYFGYVNHEELFRMTNTKYKAVEFPQLAKAWLETIAKVRISAYFNQKTSGKLTYFLFCRPRIMTMYGSLRKLRKISANKLS
jgi:hypothetical protein